MNLKKLLKEMQPIPYYIRFRDKSFGTGFVLTHEDRRYLVTAGHVVSGVNQQDVVYVYAIGKWHWYDIKAVIYGGENLDSNHLANVVNDIAILELDEKNELQLESSFQIDNDWEKKIGPGDELIFLGFPYGLHSDFPELFKFPNVRRGFPYPFVKKGILSNLSKTDENGNPYILYLDAHANAGFSGSPIFYISGNKLVLTGVITSFLREQENPNVSNSGIAIGCSIMRVLELIP